MQHSYKEDEYLVFFEGGGGGCYSALYFLGSLSITLWSIEGFN